MVLLAYGPPLAVILSHLEMQSPGFKVW